MKTVAVIAEYNPFHRGHALMLQKIREKEGECRVLALMSGSFVQRGTPAMTDKYTRAEAAVRCGANGVLELPVPYAIGSGEFFARGAAELLRRLTGIDALWFGSEKGELAALSLAASRLHGETYTARMREPDRSLSHPRYGQETFAALYGEDAFYPVSPNDILAVEYLSALSGSGIRPETYRREPGYSASDARAHFGKGGEEERIPETAVGVLKKGLFPSSFLFSALMLGFLDRTGTEELSGYAGMRGGLAGCIKNRLSGAEDYEDLVSRCTSAKYTAARIRRSILSAYLGIRGEELSAPPVFTRLLAADGEGLSYLSEIRRTAEIPVITGERDAAFLREEKSYRCGTAADRLFALLSGVPLPVFSQKPPVILS